jgi:hypothetical protein
MTVLGGGIVQYKLPPNIDAAAWAAHWLDGIRERYGMDPQIRFFETACITDNAAGAVVLPGGAK